MSLLFGVLALVPVWLLGALLIGLLGLRSDDATDVPLEFAAGVGVLGLLGTVLMVGGVALSPLWLYALLAVTAVFAVARRVRPRVRLPSAPEGALAAALCAAAVGVLLLLLTAALHDRLSWDGFAIWALKARILFVDGSLPPDFWARAGAFDFAHADYPLTLPLLDWWLFAHAGAAAPALASFAGGVWFALLVWLFWSAASRLGRRGGYTAAATLGLSVFWPIAYFAIGGTADVVMALVFLGVAVELEHASRSESSRPLLRAVVYLALGALTKNEGLAAALLGGAAVAVIAVRRGWLRPAFLAAIPVALGLAWRVWSASMGAEVEQLGDSVDPGAWVRAAGLVAEALGRLALHREWPPLFLILAIGVWRWRSERLTSQTAAWALLGGYVAVVIGVYLTTEEDLAWLLATSLERLLSTIVSAALFLTISGLPVLERGASGSSVESVVTATP